MIESATMVSSILLGTLREKRYGAIISDFSLVILFKNRIDSRSLTIAKDVTIFQTHIVKERSVVLVKTSGDRNLFSDVFYKASECKYSYL